MRQRKSPVRLLGLIAAALFGVLGFQHDSQATLYNMGAFWKQPTSRLAFTNTAFSGLTTWTCTGPVTIQSQSSTGVPQTVASDTTVSLSGTNSSHFYSDAACTNAITTVTIPANSFSANVYIKTGKVATNVLSASATNYATGTQSEVTSTLLGCTWTGGTISLTTASNWSCGHVPTNVVGDIAVFDTNCTNCSPDIPSSAFSPYQVYQTVDSTASLISGTGIGTGTISVGAGGVELDAGDIGTNSKTFTIAAGAPFVMRGGRILAGSGAMSFKGGLTMYGGTVFMGSSTMTIGGASATIGLVMNGGTFNASSSTLSIPSAANPSTFTAGTFVGSSGTLGFSGDVSISGTAAFNAGTGPLNISGNFASTGGTFTLTTNSTTATGGWSVTSPGVVVPNGGSIVFATTSSATISPGTEIYSNVSFAGSNATFTLNGTLNVAGNLTIGDTSYWYHAMKGGTINMTGTTVTVNNYGYVGTTSIRMAGNASGQSIVTSGGTDPRMTVPSLTIAAGAGNTVSFGSQVGVSGYYTYISGTLSIPGGSTLYLNGMGSTSSNITPGSIHYQNVSFMGYNSTYNLNSNTLNVDGNLVISDYGGTGCTIGSGTIAVGGNVTATTYGCEGTAVIELTGNASGQTITTTNGTEILPAIQIAAGTNPVTLSGTVNVDSAFTYTSSGAFTTSGSTLVVYPYSQNMSITPGSVHYANVTLNGWATNLDLGGATFYVDGNLSLGDQSYNGYTINNGNFSVGGNVTYTNYGFGGTATMVFTGANPTITPSGNHAVLAGNVTVSVSGTLTLGGDLTGFNAGQSVSVTSGSVNMNNFSLSVSNTLTLASGTSITRGTGTLKVGGTTITAGPYSGGTIF